MPAPRSASADAGTRNHAAGRSIHAANQPISFCFSASRTCSMRMHRHASSASIATVGRARRDCSPVQAIGPCPMPLTRSETAGRGPPMTSLRERYTAASSKQWQGRPAGSVRSGSNTSQKGSVLFVGHLMSSLAWRAGSPDEGQTPPSRAHRRVGMVKEPPLRGSAPSWPIGPHATRWPGCSALHTRLSPVAVPRQLMQVLVRSRRSTVGTLLCLAESAIRTHLHTDHR